MIDTRDAVLMTLVIAMLIAIAPQGRGAAAQGSSASLPAEVTWILSNRAQFPADQLAALRRGQVIARTETSSGDFEASAIAWRAPDAPDRLNVWAREQLAAYAASYVARGDEALIAYDDRSELVQLREEWRRILANSPALNAYAPAMVSYLTDYPRATLA